MDRRLATRARSAPRTRLCAKKLRSAAEYVLDLGTRKLQALEFEGKSKFEIGGHDGKQNRWALHTFCKFVTSGTSANYSAVKHRNTFGAKFLHTVLKTGDFHEE